MTALYATTRDTPSNVTFAAASGGSLSGSGTIYLSAQFRTRAGFTLHTSPASVSYTAGQKITCTIANTALKSGELGSVHEVVISGAASNSAAAMVRLASWKALAANQTTQNSLPVTIELTADAHIALSQTVAAAVNLPTSGNLKEGMIRYVTALSKYLKYDPDAASGEVVASAGYWVEYINWSGSANGFTTYFGTTTNLAGGCDRPLKSIPAIDVIPLPAYNPNGNASTPLRLAWQNGAESDGGATLEENTPLGVDIEAGGLSYVTVQGQQVDIGAIFSGYLFCKYKGLFRKSDGTISTANSLVNVETPVYPYNVGSGATGTNLFVPEDCPRGYGLIYEFYLKLPSGEIPGFTEGSTIRFSFYPQGDAGTYTEVGRITGDAIYDVSDEITGDQKCRVVPASATTIKSLPGGGVIKNYSFVRGSERTFPVSVADTAGQKVAISGTTRGNIIVRQPADSLLGNEALRALISTASGTYAGSGYSSTVSAATNDALQITVSYPTAVRSDYPDVVAGTTAFFNVPKLRIFVEYSSNTYEITPAATVTPNATSQVITITALPGSPTSLPTPSGDSAFCLFGYPSVPTLAAVGGGSLVAGSYRVQVYYYFPTTTNTAVSKISHSTASGCVPELGTSLADAVAGAKGYTLTTATFTQPAVNATVTVSVANSEWLAVGQPVFIESGGVYEVTAKPSPTSITVENLYDSNTAAASSITSGKLLSVSGFQGYPGISGAGVRLNFSSTTTASGISAGQIRANNATLSSVTALYVHKTDRNSTVFGTVIAAIPNGSDLYLSDESNPAVYEVYNLTSQTDNTTYITLTVTRVAGTGVTPTGEVTLSYAAKGNTGATGATGANSYGYNFTFDSGTGTGPGTGEARLNNATFASVTAIYVHETDADGGAIASLLAGITDGSQLLLYKKSAPTVNYIRFTLTSQVDNGSDRTLNVSYVASAGSFADGDALFLTPGIKGSTGSTGATGAAGADSYGYNFLFDTGTGTGPSSGDLRFNNASPGSATAIYINETDALGGNIAGSLAGVTDGSQLLAYKKSTPTTVYARYTLTSQVDNGSDRTLNVTYLNGAGSFSNNDEVFLAVALKGATGASGSLSSASSITLINASAPTTAANERALFVDSADELLKQRAESNGAIVPIANHDANTWKWSLFYG